MNTLISHQSPNLQLVHESMPEITTIDNENSPGESWFLKNPNLNLVYFLIVHA